MSGTERRLTIEQLAARTDLSVRNIRSHVTRGLLQPPYLRGRTGLYGEEHVARLELVTALQQQGFNLAAIHRLVLAPAAPSPGETVDFYRTVLGAWLTESPEVWTVEQLATAFGREPDADRLKALSDHGVVELLGNGDIEVLNPGLVRIGSRVVALGFDIDDVLTLLHVLATASRTVADAFVDRFVAAHWDPYVAAGQPPERLPELRAVIEALQPLASQAVVAAFQQAMTEVVAGTFERITDGLPLHDAPRPEPAPPVATPSWSDH